MERTALAPLHNTGAPEWCRNYYRIGGRPPEDPDSTPFDFAAILPNYYYLILGVVAAVTAVVLIAGRFGR